MVTTNDITGDRLVSKSSGSSNDRFAANFDQIFGKKEIPLGEDTRPKDRVKLGLSPSTIVVNVNSEDLK